MVTAEGIVGTLSNILITRKFDFRRKPFLIIHGVLMIVFMAIGLYVVSTNAILSYIMFALSGFVMYSQYPVYLNYPYELPKMNSQKLTIMFGMFWAFGYAIYTLFNFKSFWVCIINFILFSRKCYLYNFCICVSRN